MKTRILTDSTTDLPSSILQKYNIQVVPLILNWVGKSYRDGVDITPTEFYERLARAQVRHSLLL